MRRVHSLDGLRGLAVFVMIEVHVTNALLAPALRATAAFRVVDALNGLVAPAFLACTGVAWAWTRDRGTLRDKLRRSAILFALGYALHVSGLFVGDRASFLQCDILQVIAVGLALLSLLSAARAPTWLYPLGVPLFFLLAPRVWLIDTHAWPALLRPYVSNAVMTQFPIFPWMGFVFGGAALGLAARERLLRAFLLFGGVATFGAGLALLIPTPPHDVYANGPAGMFLRLGLVFGLGAIFAAIESVRPEEGRARRLLSLLGHRSLLVYFAHIVLVYSRQPLSLRSLIGPQLGPAAVIAVWLAVTAAMTLLAAKTPRVKWI